MGMLPPSPIIGGAGPLLPRLLTPMDWQQTSGKRCLQKKIQRKNAENGILTYETVFVLLLALLKKLVLLMG